MTIVCIAPQAIDGDSIRCASVGQVRLLGIDAPDRTDSRPCREGFGDHVCDTIAATNAKAVMKRILRRGPVRIEPVGRDRYGRLLGIAFAGSAAINCLMLKVPGVRYIPRYDDRRRVWKICR